MSDIAKRLRSLADNPSPHLFDDLREAAVIIATWEDALSGYQNPHDAVCGLCDGPIEKDREESCYKCHLENEVHHLTASIDQLYQLLDLGDDAIAALTHNMEVDDEDDDGDDEHCGEYPIPISGTHGAATDKDDTDEDDDEDVPGML